MYLMQPSHLKTLELVLVACISWGGPSGKTQPQNVCCAHRRCWHVAASVEAANTAATTTATHVSRVTQEHCDAHRPRVVMSSQRCMSWVEGNQWTERLRRILSSDERRHVGLTKGCAKHAGTEPYTDLVGLRRIFRRNASTLRPFPACALFDLGRKRPCRLRSSKQAALGHLPLWRHHSQMWRALASCSLLRSQLGIGRGNSWKGLPTKHTTTENHVGRLRRRQKEKKMRRYRAHKPLGCGDELRGSTGLASSDRFQSMKGGARAGCG
jgi:hypothetical protein